MSNPLFIIGDIHGELSKLRKLLREAGLTNSKDHWHGGDTRLWFMGDLVDRGPDSLGVVDLVMQLQRQAAETGGSVQVLLGNHEVLLAAAYKFGQKSSRSAFVTSWERNGGFPEDRTRITEEQFAWIIDLPALAREEDWLLMHADAMFYTHYGDSVEEVNAGIHRVLHSDRPTAWEHLLEGFSERMMFLPGRTDGANRAVHLLKLFGGTQIIHGHTPIHYLENQAPNAIKGPYIYANGLCVNVDGGMYAGGSGFVVRLPALEPEDS